MVEFAARQRDGLLHRLDFSQFILVEILLVLEEIGKLEVYLGAALVFQSGALRPFQTFEQVCKLSKDSY